MICPRCHTWLSQVKRPQGLVYQCASCRGFAVSIPVLRKLVPQGIIRDLWNRAQEKQSRSGAECPVCRRKMADVAVGGMEKAPIIDVCIRCQFVWFDRRELEQLPPVIVKQPDRETLPLEVREKLAVLELERLKRREQLATAGDQYPEEWWQWIPGLLGLPVELDAPAVRSVPWLTWSITAAMVVTFLLTFNHLETILDVLGLKPAEFMRLGGLTLITSFFLHGSVWHLLGNGYFLLIFGDQVEDDLGQWRFAALLALAALAGDILHILGDPRSTVPCIGASGGISGIIAFYALRFPSARLGIMLRYFLIFRWIQFPAWAGFVAWLVLQIILAIEQVQGVTNVSALAHLGGCLVCVGAWGLWQSGLLKAG